MAVQSKKHSLSEKLYILFHELGKGNPDSWIDEIQSDYPEVLRLIAEHMEEHEPYAVNTINALKHSAETLEGCGIDMSKLEGHSWEIEERLGLKN